MKTASTLQHFVLKDSKIYWIENMPEIIDFVEPDGSFCNSSYDNALQSAIDSAVEVSNQDEVRHASSLNPTVGVPYTLECSVGEKLIYDRMGYPGTDYIGVCVTFPQPETITPESDKPETEDQEKLWKELYNRLDEEAREIDSYDFGLPRHGAETIISKLSKDFTIIRK